MSAIEEAVCIQLAKFNDIEKSVSNARWSNHNKQPVTINQGDNISVTKSFIDTRNLSSAGITILEDTPLELEMYFYWINDGNPGSTSTGFSDLANWFVGSSPTPVFPTYTVELTLQSVKNIDISIQNSAQQNPFADGRPYLLCYTDNSLFSQIWQYTLPKGTYSPDALATLLTTNMAEVKKQTALALNKPNAVDWFDPFTPKVNFPIDFTEDQPFVADTNSNSPLWTLPYTETNYDSEGNATTFTGVINSQQFLQIERSDGLPDWLSGSSGSFTNPANNYPQGNVPQYGAGPPPKPSLCFKNIISDCPIPNASVNLPIIPSNPTVIPASQMSVGLYYQIVSLGDTTNWADVGDLNIPATVGDDFVCISNNGGVPPPNPTINFMQMALNKTYAIVTTGFPLALPGNDYDTNWEQYLDDPAVGLTFSTGNLAPALINIINDISYININVTYEVFSSVNIDWNQFGANLPINGDIPYTQMIPGNVYEIVSLGLNYNILSTLSVSNLTVGDTYITPAPISITNLGILDGSVPQFTWNMVDNTLPTTTTQNMVVGQMYQVVAPHSGLIISDCTNGGEVSELFTATETSILGANTVYIFSPDNQGTQFITNNISLKDANGFEYIDLLLSYTIYISITITNVNGQLLFNYAPYNENGTTPISILGSGTHEGSPFDESGGTLLTLTIQPAAFPGLTYPLIFTAEFNPDARDTGGYEDGNIWTMTTPFNSPPIQNLIAFNPTNPITFTATGVYTPTGQNTTAVVSLPSNAPIYDTDWLQLGDTITPLAVGNVFTCAKNYNIPVADSLNYIVTGINYTILTTVDTINWGALGYTNDPNNNNPNPIVPVIDPPMLLGYLYQIISLGAFIGELNGVAIYDTGWQSITGIINYEVGYRFTTTDVQDVLQGIESGALLNLIPNGTTILVYDAGDIDWGSYGTVYPPDPITGNFNVGITNNPGNADPDDTTMDASFYPTGTVQLVISIQDKLPFTFTATATGSGESTYTGYINGTGKVRSITPTFPFTFKCTEIPAILPVDVTYNANVIPTGTVNFSLGEGTVKEIGIDPNNPNFYIYPLKLVSDPVINTNFTKSNNTPGENIYDFTMLPTQMINYNFPLVGSTEIELAFNDTANIFQWNYTHSPILQATAPTTAGTPVSFSEVVGIVNSFIPDTNPFTETSPAKGYVSSTCKLVAKSGCMFKRMQPESFWFGVLGFSKDLLVSEQELGLTSNGSLNPISLPRDLNRFTYERFNNVTTRSLLSTAMNFTQSANYPNSEPSYITGMYYPLPDTAPVQSLNSSVIDSWYDYEMAYNFAATIISAFNNAVGNNKTSPIDGTSPSGGTYATPPPWNQSWYQALDQTVTIPAISTPTLVSDSYGHYLIEIEGYNSSLLNEQQKYGIKAIVSSYYNNIGSFTSLPFNDEAFLYQHVGESITLNNFRVRILNGKLEEVAGLGDNSCVYLQINKAITPVEVQQV